MSMRYDQIVLIFEDGADHTPWNHVKGIKIAYGGEPATATFSLEDIRGHLLEISHFRIENERLREQIVALERELPEQDLVICQAKKEGKCSQLEGNCRHAKPHKKFDNCNTWYCAYACEKISCIPVLDTLKNEAEEIWHCIPFYCWKKDAPCNKNDPPAVIPEKPEDMIRVPITQYLKTILDISSQKQTTDTLLNLSANQEHRLDKLEKIHAGCPWHNATWGGCPTVTLYNSDCTTSILGEKHKKDYFVRFFENEGTWAVIVEHGDKGGGNPIAWFITEEDAQEFARQRNQEPADPTGTH